MQWEMFHCHWHISPRLLSWNKNDPLALLIYLHILSGFESLEGQKDFLIATSYRILLHCVNLINVNIILWPNLKGALHGDSFYSDGFMCKMCTMYHISSFLINGKFHLNELSSKLPRFSVLMWEVSDIRSTVLVSA